MQSDCNENQLLRGYQDIIKRDAKISHRGVRRQSESQPDAAVPGELRQIDRLLRPVVESWRRAGYSGQDLPGRPIVGGNLDAEEIEIGFGGILDEVREAGRCSAREAE